LPRLDIERLQQVLALLCVGLPLRALQLQDDRLQAHAVVEDRFLKERAPLGIAAKVREAQAQRFEPALIARVEDEREDSGLRVAGGGQVPEDAADGLAKAAVEVGRVGALLEGFQRLHQLEGGLLARLPRSLKCESVGEITPKAQLVEVALVNLL